jgi:hypothetical protein
MSIAHVGFNDVECIYGDEEFVSRVTKGNGKSKGNEHSRLITRGKSALKNEARRDRWRTWQPRLSWRL